MNLIAILDTETTGLDETAQCIEIAVALYSVPHAAVIRTFSALIHSPTNEAESINRIPQSLVSSEEVRVRTPAVWAEFFDCVSGAEAFVAHHTAFDRRFVPEAVVGGRPWICTKDDLIWDRAPGPRPSLVNLCLAYDLGVSHAHRAAVDVDLIGRLFTRFVELGGDLDAHLARGLRPKGTFQAMVPFERKDEAKAAGFQWEAVNKRWTKTMAIEDAEKLPFAVKVVAP